jgi:predicted nuclease of predicted toxin-antitoxin system
MSVRYHLDEHIDPAVAVGLRGRGIDVTTTSDAGLLSADDEEHLRFAVSEKRAIMTHDEDFLVFHSQGRPHYGIVFCHQEARTIGQIVQSLVLIDACLTTDEMRDHVEFI